METGESSEAQLRQDFATLVNLSCDSKDEQSEAAVDEVADVDEYGYEDEDDEDEEEEFSFMIGGANTSPIAAEDAFINGQIKTVYPLFNQDLVFSGEDSIDLPMRPPVNKVFVEATAEGAEWTERKAVEASPEICKKSNSTGFSKIWRFKDLLGRSNSDGRDTFVFLNNGDHTAADKAAPAEEKAAPAEEKAAPVKKKKKGKTASLSAHEAYLKSKAKVEERRRSYLPYRPELMGFFTNVNGGLTKNVHPF